MVGTAPRCNSAAAAFVSVNDVPPVVKGSCPFWCQAALRALHQQLTERAIYS